ncbi:MAG: radical SAM family heme chaperone HemW [Prevotella sp.]|nr:radical SAM family heme chaperone HemW [Bacteroides sp.]MCM1366527.1 radical SAM family heme chaperone HemW [Prevotella sp.]
MNGLYIHIPICRRKCLYCDFYSVGESVVRKDILVDALIRELQIRRSEITGEVSSIYIGGGTPSLFGIEDLNRLLVNVRKIFEICKDVEITIELNPDDVSNEYAKGLKFIGINRVSVGIQSLDDGELKRVGRRHDAKSALKCMEIISNEFDNCSYDLIFGLPGQTLDSWRRSLYGVLQFSPKHISAYSLMYEEGTALTFLRCRGDIRELDEGLSEAMFYELCEMSSRIGLRQYEISNFAREGFESRHNSSYWKGVPYLGIGPSAHSYDGMRCRRYNLPDVKNYVRGIMEDGNPVISEEILSDDELREEYVMTRLRTCSGIDLVEFKEKFGVKEYEQLLVRMKPIISKGMLKRIDGRVTLTRKSILISDSIIVNLI